MTRPKLELIGVSKEYSDGSVVAVDDIDLSVDAGETVALLGPSGCGKSTTLAMIVGLEEPTRGDILIDGRSVRGVPAGQRNVGLVFQDYAVFTHMTVEKNLAFGLEVRGVERAEIRRRVGEVAELLSLEEMMKEKASRLGGSQLQRVAIGRTLVTRPALLLLDEPLSNLETEARLAMRRELRRLRQEIGLTIIYVTHDQIEALSLATRIAVMSSGKIRQYDATSAVYDRPEHVFVAGFMGSPPMNLLRGRVVREGGAARFVSGRFALPLEAAPHIEGNEVTLGVRPETLRLSPNGSGFAATVTLVEPRGPTAVVTLDVAGAVFQALVPAADRPAEGATVSLVVDRGALVFFSGETGRALAAAAHREVAA